MGMNNQDWVERLTMLMVRFSHLGIGPDIPTLSRDELWGIYRYLDRLAGEE